MPSRPSSNHRTDARADKNKPKSASAGRDEAAHSSRTYTRSDSPGARSYAEVLSSPEPLLSRRRLVKYSEAKVPATDAKFEASSATSDIEFVSGPRLVAPSTPKKGRARLHKCRRASTPSVRSDADESNGVLIVKPSKSVSRSHKHRKNDKRDRSVDAYEEDSFVELDDSDGSEVRRAVLHAGCVDSQAPRYRPDIEDSPSPVRPKVKIEGGPKASNKQPARPRIPSAVKSSLIQTRGSHGIYKRRRQPDAATLSEEERALNATPVKRRRSGKISGLPASPVPSHLSDDTTPPPVEVAFRDLLTKKKGITPDVPRRSSQITSSSPAPPVEPSSPSLSPAKVSLEQPISISPLKINTLDPSPEIPSPADPEAKRRRGSIFNKVLSNDSSSQPVDESRGRPTERGRCRHLSPSEPRPGRRSLVDFERQSEMDFDSLPRTPPRRSKEKTRPSTTKRRRHFSPDCDMISSDSLPSTAKKIRKRKASVHSPSPSRRSATARGKMRARSPPPPLIRPTREEIRREAEELLSALMASRQEREAVLRRLTSESDAGSSKAAAAVPNTLVDQAALGVPPSNPPIDQAKSVVPEPNPPVDQAKSVVPVSNSLVEKKPSLAALFNPPAALNGSTEVSSIDLAWITDFQSIHSTYVESLPETCEVSNPELWDPALSDDYPLLPPLLYGALLSWKSVAGAGALWFSGWAEHLPTINKTMLTAAVRFTKRDHFVNPSRDDPRNTFVYDATGLAAGVKGVLYAKLPPQEPSAAAQETGSVAPNEASDAQITQPEAVAGAQVTVLPQQTSELSAEATTDNKPPSDAVNKTKEEILHRSRMATCLSTIYVAESQITKPSTTGLKNKFIKGVLHTQEYEHLAGYFCMLFHQEGLVAQIDDGQHLSFHTMGNKDGDTSTSTATASAKSFKSTRSKGLFKAIQPSTHHQYSRTHTKTVLNASDTIPVFNAVGRNFRFSDDIADFDKLPRHVGEIPEGSCAVVGYTASVYKNSKDQLSLATNIQFAIILALK